MFKVDDALLSKIKDAISTKNTKVQLANGNIQYFCLLCSGALASGCSSSCNNACDDTCSAACQENCSGVCRDDCQVSCDDNCSQGCYGN